jgi:diguanylate cyclase (GGDEF)-like protein
MAINDRRRGGAPIWMLISVLLLVPLSAVAYFANGQLVDIGHRVHRAHAAQISANRSVALLRYRIAIGAEEVLQNGLATASLTGVDVATASRFMSFDFEVELELREANTDRMAASVKAAEALDPLVLDQVTELVSKARMAKASSPSTNLAAYTEAKEALVGAYNNELAELSADAPPPLRRALDDVAATTEALGRSAKLFASAIARLPAASDSIDRGSTVGDRAVLDVAESRLPTMNSLKLREQWAVIDASNETEDARAAIDGLIAMPDRANAPGGAGFATLATSAVSGFRHQQQLGDLTESAIKLAIARSADVESGERVRQRRIRLVVVSVVFSCLVLLVLGVKFLTRSLNQAVRQAERLSLGEIDADTKVGGPREVRVVAEALDVARTNLNHMAMQAKALSESDLDHPSLSATMPGPVGRLLKESVENLAAVMRTQEELRSQLAHDASHDGLTGLLNRRAALEYAERMVAASRRRGDLSAVLFIDLDGFKRVNDERGHRAGDEVLVQVAHRLSSALRSSDIVARLGGDEFLCVLSSTTSVAAIEIAQRMVTLLSTNWPGELTTLGIGASIGIALDSDHQLTLDDLVVLADEAVYNAKANGRHRVEIFDTETPRANNGAALSTASTVVAAGTGSSRRCPQQAGTCPQPS